MSEVRSLAAEIRIDAALLMGRPAEAIILTEQAIARSALRERPRAQLMLALYRSGRQVDALAAFADFRARLDDDLGLAPSAELTALHQRILRQDAGLDLRPVHDLAPDLADPDSSPAPARPPDPITPPSDRTVPGNLPTVPPELIGRDGALASLTAMLGQHRLVTITGPGGVGKTNLARVLASAARTAGQFADGVWLIELAPVPVGALVVDAVTTALAVPPASNRSSTDRLIDFLHARRALLVIDNLEHLVEQVAPIAKAILVNCPGVTVLTTSQVPLNISLESVFALEPMAVRNAPGGAAPEAVELFLHRASRVAPTFSHDPVDPATLSAIAELCRRLDGLPLAIELAAGRMRSMTPAEVIRQLPDRFRLLRSGDRLAAERHRTLLAVVTWSYRLLEPVEQDLFDRLSIFRGRFGFEDVVDVLGWNELDVIDVLGSLVDRSMVQAVPVVGGSSTSFTLLDTMRAFGTQRLAERGEAAAMLDAHADHLLRQLRSAAAGVLGDDPGPSVRAVTRQFDDLRAAFERAMEHDLGKALEIVGVLADWSDIQLSSELFGWAEVTADRAVAAGVRDADRARWVVLGYSVAARGARYGGDLRRAEDFAHRALQACPDPGDPIRRHPHYVLSEMYLYSGRLDESIALAESMRTDAIRAGDGLMERWGLIHQALALAYGGDTRRALAIVEPLAAAPAPALAAAWTSYTLGEVVMDSDPDRAARVLAHTVQEARLIGDRFLTGVALVSAASIRARYGDPQHAVPAFREVVEHWQQLGNWTQQWTTFRSVADLVERLDDGRSAALVLGAVRNARRTGAIFGADAARLDDLERRLAERLGPHELDGLMSRGARLSDGEALQVVRAALERLDTGPQT